MAIIRHFATALAFAACAGNVPTNYVNAAPAAPTKDALVTLEKSGYQAWKSKDATFWDTFLSDKFVGYGSSGKLDKASAIQEFRGLGCEIKSFDLSNERMKPLGNDAALITYKTTIDGTCEGQKVPVNSWAASVYVLDGDQWKGVFHAESPIVDLTATSAKPVANKEVLKRGKPKPAGQEAGTEVMLAIERAVWEAWRVHDAKKLADLTASDISFINAFGTYLATKSDALKDWSAAGCDVKQVGFTDAAGTMLSPTVGILTFTATADGTCYGQAPPPIWGTSIYVKEADTWKWIFGINTPARR